MNLPRRRFHIGHHKAGNSCSSQLLLIWTMRFSALVVVAVALDASSAFVAPRGAGGPISARSLPPTRLDLFSSAPVASVINNRHAASDWFYNIKSLPNSEVLREVKSPVLAVAAFSTVVSALHRLAGDCICIPGTVHGFLMSALGLLLVFRTNSAYQRFYVSSERSSWAGLCVCGATADPLLWFRIALSHPCLAVIHCEQEGRKIWESILSVSRNLSRLVTLYRNDIGASRHEAILKLVAAYPYLLRHHVRSGYSRQKGCLCESNPDSIAPEHRLRLVEPLFASETRYEASQPGDAAATESRKCYVDKRNLPWSLLTPKSLRRIAWAQNRPLWVCDRLGEHIMDIAYSPNFTSRERLTMLGSIDKLSNAIGECERIHQTVVPLNYARHSLRSLTLWLFTVPFALVKDLGFLTPVVASCIAWLLFGVYQIGYSIEDPFQGSLRLSLLCDSIRKDVMGVLDETKSQRRSAYATSNWIDDEGEPSDDPSIEVTTAIAPSQLHPDLIPEDERLLNPPLFIPEAHGTWNVVMADKKA